MVVKHLPRIACSSVVGATAQSSRGLPPGKENLLVHSEGQGFGGIESFISSKEQIRMCVRPYFWSCLESRRSKEKEKYKGKVLKC